MVLVLRLKLSRSLYLPRSHSSYWLMFSTDLVKSLCLIWSMKMRVWKSQRIKRWDYLEMETKTLDGLLDCGPWCWHRTSGRSLDPHEFYCSPAKKQQKVMSSFTNMCKCYLGTDCLSLICTNRQQKSSVVKCIESILDYGMKQYGRRNVCWREFTSHLSNCVDTQMIRSNDRQCINRDLRSICLYFHSDSLNSSHLHYTFFDESAFRNGCFVKIPTACCGQLQNSLKYTVHTWLNIFEGY